MHASLRRGGRRGAADLDVGQDLVVLALGHKGPHAGVGLQGVAHVDALGALLEPRQEGGRQPLLQQQPAGRRAHLSIGPEDAKLHQPQHTVKAWRVCSVSS